MPKHFIIAIIAIMILTFVPHEAYSYNTGDCTGSEPNLTSGAVWNITADNNTVCNNTVILFNSNITVYGNLTFRNVTLSFNSTVIYQTLYSFNNSRINITNSTINSSTTSSCRGTPICSGRDELGCVDGCTWNADFQTCTGTPSVACSSYNLATTPTCQSAGCTWGQSKFAFLLKRGSNISITSTTFRDFGWGTAIGTLGIEINETVLNFYNNTMIGGYYGTTIYSSGNIIENNTITNSTINSIDLHASNNTIKGNIIFTLISGNPDGIILTNANNNTIISNNVTVSDIGIQMSASSNNTISSNTINSSGGSTPKAIDVTGTSYNNSITNNTIYGSSVAYGIGIAYSNNTIENNTIKDNLYPIYVNAANNTIRGNNISTSVSSAYGIIAFNYYNTIISNEVKMTGTSSFGIALSSARYNLISSNLINSSGTNAKGIYVYDASYNNTLILNTIYTSAGTSSYGIHILDDTLFNSTDNKIISNIINATSVPDINVSGVKSGTNYVINNTFNETRIAGDSTLTIQWFLDVKANNTAGANLQNANVTLWNVTGQQIFSLLTDSNGNIVAQNVTEYVQNNATKIYQTNLTMNTTASGYVTDSRQINLTSSTALVVTLVDSTGPTIVIQSPTNTTYGYNTSVMLNYTTGDVSGISACKYSLDDATNVSMTGCANATFNASQGWHKMFVFVNDTLGNNASANVNFTIDSIAPNVTITNPTNNQFIGVTSTAVNYTMSESGSCKLEWINQSSNGVNITLSSCQNTTLTNLSDGIHRVRIIANDSANNNGTSGQVNFTIDVTAPVVSLSLSASSIYISGSTIITCTATDNVDQSPTVAITVAKPSGTVTHTSGSGFSDTSVAGTYTATCNATDDTGNSAVSSSTFTVSAQPSGGGSPREGGGSTSTDIIISTNIFVNMLPEIPSVIKINKAESSISEIVISVNNAIKESTITTTKLAGKPTSMAEPPGSVYQYMDINHNLPADKLKSVKIKFSIAKSWFLENGYESGNVALLRYSSGWQKLYTVKIGESATEIKYEATSPGMSVFAVSAERLTPVNGNVVAKKCGNNMIDEGEQCDGSYLNDESCTTRGFDSGTLSCKDCHYDTSACVSASSSMCGNGVCESDEDINLCPVDCSVSGAFTFTPEQKNIAMLVIVVIILTAFVWLEREKKSVRKR